MNNFEKLENLIGYKFNNINILNTALTHISFANENNCDSYERLEFLGDAIIEMVVSEYIYNNLSVDAGILTKLRASLVSTENLYKISNNLNLCKYTQIGNSLKMLSKKNTADLFESLVASVYLDGGLISAKNLIYKFIVIDDDNIQTHIKNSIDYKTKLQELMQSKGKCFKYELLSSSGQDHAKIFEVGLYVNDVLVSNGVGTSKQKAEEASAENYLKTIN